MSLRVGASRLRPSLQSRLRRLAIGLQLLRQRRKINGRSFNESGFRRWRVGNATITKVVELEGEGFGEILLPQADAAALAQLEWLNDGWLGPRGGLKLSVHSFLVEIAGQRILVDTNVGNGKRRKVPIWNRLSTPWLDDLGRAGFPPETIDLVVCTHLHIDHVGWNTRRTGDRWIPTFPNARYVIVRGEYDYWRARRDDDARAELWKDSIEPIVVSGQLDLVADDAVLAPGVRFLPTPGHTEHHVSVRIDSDGQSALITGDVLHHPAQVARPDWSSTFDTNPQLSAQSRGKLLDRLAEEDVLVLGTAFPDPSAGRIHRRSDGFHLAPEPSL